MYVIHYTHFQAKKGFIYSMAYGNSEVLYIAYSSQLTLNVNNPPYKVVKTSGENTIKGADQNKLY